MWYSFYFSFIFVHERAYLDLFICFNREIFGFVGWQLFEAHKHVALIEVSGLYGNVHVIDSQFTIYFAYIFFSSLQNKRNCVGFLEILFLLSWYWYYNSFLSTRFSRYYFWIIFFCCEPTLSHTWRNNVHCNNGYCVLLTYWIEWEKRIILAKQISF